MVRSERLLVPVRGEGFVEAAHLAGRPVRVDDALGRGLVVLPLGLVPDLTRPLLVTGLDGPVEVFGEVAETGSGALVVGAALDALLVAFGWCGHAGSSDKNWPDRENVTQVE